jgi:hypothetical protein
MRRFAAFCVAALLVGCASYDVPPPENWTITYYDRNGDGIVDYELHTLGRGMADADWALIDTKFRGRYDLAFIGDTFSRRKKWIFPFRRM